MSESQKEWEIIYEGRDFLIGYLPKEGLVRINRFSTIITEGDSSSNFGIHPLSSNISSIVNGIHENVYTSNNPDLDSPPFYSLSKEASEVLVNSKNKEDVISKFQKIVLKNAPEDEFLILSPDSIINWLSQKSSRKISFDVSDRFSSVLKSKDDILQLSIKELPLNTVGWKKKIPLKTKGDNPKVLFSEPFKTRRIVVSPTNEIKKPLLDDSNKIDDKAKSEFLKSHVQEQTIEEIAPKRRKSNFWRWVFIILGLIFLILLLRNCNNSGHPEYYFDRGVRKYESKEYDKAIGDFDKSIDTDPNYFNAYWYRSLAHFDQNNYQDALFDIEKAISLDNNNWEFYHLRGRIKMSMANSKYSRKYKEALDDFSKSLSLNDGEENAKSYYYRGRTHELLEDSMECPDYYLACEYSFEDACSIVDKFCYPETGFMPYNEFFGPGVKMGEKKFEVDNSNGTVDVVVALINNRTGRRIRAQFIRAGQELIMDGIPVGSYKLQIYEGNYWSNSLILKDGISKGGFLANAEFKEVEFVWDFDRETDSRGVILNSSEGDLNSRNINDAEFFN